MNSGIRDWIVIAALTAGVAVAVTGFPATAGEASLLDVPISVQSTNLTVIPLVGVRAIVHPITVPQVLEGDGYPLQEKAAIVRPVPISIMRKASVIQPLKLGSSARDIPIAVPQSAISLDPSQPALVGSKAGPAPMQLPLQ